MSQACCPTPVEDARTRPGYVRALWIALVVNALMFVVEIAGGWQGESVSLLADALDFAGDAANYGLSLGAIALGVVWQSRAALLKGWVMVTYGALVLVRVVWLLATGSTPEPLTMGIIGALALTANLAVAVLLYRFRDGNANMRSVWLCTRNDAIGNVAVLGAALGVFGTGSNLPDLAVAVIMLSLALHAGVTTIARARDELSHLEGAREHA